MFEALARVRYQVQNLEQAREWYRNLLGKEPILDAPFAVAFLIGDAVLMLAPGQARLPGLDERTVAYWNVTDLDIARSRMLEMGATACGEAASVGDTRSARLVDPFGNVVGISERISAARRAVDHQPSETARVTAYCRALSAHDEREGLRGPDYMAEIFLKERGGTSLRDQPSREWAITRLLSPGLYAYLYARTAWFDAVFADELRSNVRQIVLVGAGYDSRAYRFRDMLRDTRIFEVDIQTTQERKRSILEEAKVAIPDQVRFVPVNFKTDTLDQVLPNHGFDTAARTLFIWEGVMYYLEAESVDRVLEFVVRSSGHGSCLCFDYMNQAIPSARAAEPFQFWVSSDEIEPYLAKRGLRLAEHLTPHDIDKTFLTLPDGTPTGHTRPFFCFARAEVAS